jgi:hypothetical protein
MFLERELELALGADSGKAEIVRACHGKLLELRGSLTTWIHEE